MCELLSLLPEGKEILRQVRKEDDGWLIDVPSAPLVDLLFIQTQCYDKCLTEEKGVILT